MSKKTGPPKHQNTYAWKPNLGRKINETVSRRPASLPRLLFSVLVGPNRCNHCRCSRRSPGAGSGLCRRSPASASAAGTKSTGSASMGFSPLSYIHSLGRWFTCVPRSDLLINLKWPNWDANSTKIAIRKMWDWDVIGC